VGLSKRGYAPLKLPDYVLFSVNAEGIIMVNYTTNVKEMGKIPLNPSFSKGEIIGNFQMGEKNLFLS
jgi:hypothetical protein